MWGTRSAVRWLWHNNLSSLSFRFGFHTCAVRAPHRLWCAMMMIFLFRRVPRSLVPLVSLIVLLHFVWLCFREVVVVDAVSLWDMYFSLPLCNAFAIAQDTRTRSTTEATKRDQFDGIAYVPRSTVLWHSIFNSLPFMAVGVCVRVWILFVFYFTFVLCSRYFSRVRHFDYYYCFKKVIPRFTYEY